LCCMLFFDIRILMTHFGIFKLLWHRIYIYVVEWSRALDVRLSEWCCSVSMVWVQIPSKNKNFTALKSNSNTVWFNFQTYIYIQSNLSIATIEGSSENRSHKTGGHWIEVVLFAPKISRGKT
jgi:hypothetical protein